MIFVITALSLGFLGSFHCLGMCGPIALALPVHRYSWFKKTGLVLSYNIGRAVTYSIFGLLAGIVGQSIIAGGQQRALSIGIGIMMLLAVFIPSKQTKGIQSLIFAKFNLLKKTLSRLLNLGQGSPFFLVGVLNGFLPCGLVYLGLSAAAASGDMLRGSLFMALFALGTFPAMITLPLAGSLVSINSRNRIRKAMPLLITCMALLFILRGLDLGIPYISPGFNKNGTSCHSQVPQQHNILCTGQSSAPKK